MRSRCRGEAAGLTLVLAVALFIVAGCVTDSTTGLWLRVSNDTDQRLTLRYEEPGHEMDLGTVEPGRSLLVESVFEQLGPSCHGPFVARSGSGEEVARLDRACPNADWSIKQPTDS